MKLHDWTFATQPTTLERPAPLAPRTRPAEPPEWQAERATLALMAEIEDEPDEPAFATTLPRALFPVLLEHLSGSPTDVWAT